MDVIDELMRLLKESGLTPCLWFGLPDCPKCGVAHGDPKCSEEHDFALRIILSEHGDSNLYMKA